MIPLFLCDKIPSEMRISILFTLCLLMFGPAFAQETAPVAAQPPAAASAPPPRFEAAVTTVDAMTLRAGANVIRLWGVNALQGQGPGFDLKARSALEQAIGTSKVTCQTKESRPDLILASCTNAQNEDLGIRMVQGGFVGVDRAAIAGSAFEQPYLTAAQHAQSRRLGAYNPEGAEPGKNNFILGMSLGVFALTVIAFGVLTITIMRGFKKITDIQKQNIDMMERERKLRDKERNIIAIMLDSELKANKSKIEAYRLVYEEMMKSLREIGRTPKYKKAGDIVQKQPALSRSVFDRNTDKLDMLGPELASGIVHYYARIKSNAEYINLEPSTPIEEAINILDGALKNAERLEELSQKLLVGFHDFGIISADYKD